MVQNIIQLFYDTVARQGSQICYHRKHEGQWQTVTWNEAAEVVQNLASHLVSLGVKEGSRVAIMSQTRMEWTIADLAILSLGAVTVPIYPSYPPARVEHILRDADVHFVFVENSKLQKVVEQASADLSVTIIPVHFKTLPQLGFSPPSMGGDEGEGDNVATIIYTSGTTGTPKEFSPPSMGGDEGEGDNVATIIYTSGTTGVPKGVVLTHANIMAEIRATSEIFKFAQNEIGLMCLPLSHVLGRLMQFHHIALGYQLAFVESLDKFAESCMEICPHFTVGVPRMLEKMHERVSGALSKIPPWKRKIFSWFIKRKLAARLGGRFRLFICGGAPLANGLGEFFHNLGLLILEGYGLTETFAAAVVNRPNDFRFGTAGKPISGVEVKIDKDGEILLKGPTIFREYLNLPKETSDVKSSDGWFRTGDIGELKDGFLKITDRKKELIVTSGGQNIAPQMIESLLMESRYISYCMVYGDGKKYLTAIITLNWEAIAECLRCTSSPPCGERLGEGGVIDSRIYDLIKSVVDEKNCKLTRYETIKKFTILPNDFSQETGELTPTLKLRRKFVNEKYHDLLEAMYK